VSLDTAHSPSTPDFNVSSGPMSQRPNRSGVLAVCMVVFIAAVVIVVAYASHYQPLSLRTTNGEGNGHTASGLATTVQQTELQNGGLFGVNVLAVRQGVVTSSPRPARLPSPQTCPVGTPYDGNCHQNATGLLVGNVFHPLVVPGGGKRALLWTFAYNCRGIQVVKWPSRSPIDSCGSLTPCNSPQPQLNRFPAKNGTELRTFQVARRRECRVTLECVGRPSFH
jgi:hypothetical protein